MTMKKFKNGNIEHPGPQLPSFKSGLKSQQKSYRKSKWAFTTHLSLKSTKFLLAD